MAHTLAIVLAVICSAFGEAAVQSATGSNHLRHGSVRLSTEHTDVTSSARHKASSSFVRSLEFKRALRVCNAYPSTSQVEVQRGEDKLTDTPMPYKTCRQFGIQLNPFDKLEFRVGEEALGSFAVSELPSNDAELLLVVYRHDATSSAVSFVSHVFANLVNPQVAVLDTFRGTRKSVANIQDMRGSNWSRTEELRYDSVIAVNPGVYEVLLRGADKEHGSLDVSAQFVALNGENYVVMRCGLQSGAGELGESLLVYPQSDPKALTGAAVRMGSGALAAAFAVFMVVSVNFL